jgi:hypothetical protein
MFFWMGKKLGFHSDERTHTENIMLWKNLKLGRRKY